MDKKEIDDLINALREAKEPKGGSSVVIKKLGNHDGDREGAAKDIDDVIHAMREAGFPPSAIRTAEKAKQMALDRTFGSNERSVSATNESEILLQLTAACERLQENYEHAAEHQTKVAKYLELPPVCHDAEGTKIAVGDRLICGKNFPGRRKEVFEIAFGMAKLSDAKDLTANDGWWYESIIKDRGFIVDKEWALKPKAEKKKK